MPASIWHLSTTRGQLEAGSRGVPSSKAILAGRCPGDDVSPKARPVTPLKGAEGVVEARRGRG